MAKIKTEDLRIKIIKPFYGNNPERAKELIRKEIAIEYKPKNV